jgi:hypothetical protein
MANNHDRADIAFHWFWPESSIQVSVNSYDDLAKATPEGEPWDVVLPTTLVYLQDDATLPVFEA